MISENNLSVAAENCESDFGSDLRAVALALSRAKPDLMIASTIIGTFAKRLSELHSTAAVLATSDMLEELNNPGLDKALVEGWYFMQWEDPKDFAAQYRQRYGEAPQHEASKSYYALKALVEATRVRKSGQALVEALRSIKIQKSDGDIIDFSKHPFPNQTKAKLFKVSKGQAEEVRQNNKIH